MVYCIEIVKYLHPDDTSSVAKLRKAIGNYFCTVTYRKKIKSSSGCEKSTEEEGSTDDTMQ